MQNPSVMPEDGLVTSITIHTDEGLIERKIDPPIFVKAGTAQAEILEMIVKVDELK